MQNLIKIFTVYSGNIQLKFGNNVTINKNFARGGVTPAKENSRKPHDLVSKYTVSQIFFSVKSTLSIMESENIYTGHRITVNA